MTELNYENKLIEIFISYDDFEKIYEHWAQNYQIGSQSITRRPELNDSEIMTILIFYRSCEPSLVRI